MKYSSSPSGGARILFVYDDIELVSWIRHLENARYQVSVARGCNLVVSALARVTYLKLKIICPAASMVPSTSTATLCRSRKIQFGAADEYLQFWSWITSESVFADLSNSSFFPGAPWAP